jgi:CheY-like chemotaxis protein
VRWRRPPEKETDDEPAGIGVTFIFSSDEEAQKVKSLLDGLDRSRQPEGQPEAPFRVLLADDSPAVREMFRFAVKRFHRDRQDRLRKLDVVEVDNGNAAWEFLQDSSYDLAIIDYYMPIMNGAELIRRLRQHDKHVSLPVIVVSTGSEEVCQEVYSAGADLFIRKPVLHNQLLKSLELLIDLKQHKG